MYILDIILNSIFVYTVLNTSIYLIYLHKKCASRGDDEIGFSGYLSLFMGISIWLVELLAIFKKKDIQDLKETVSFYVLVLIGLLLNFGVILLIS